MSTVPSDRLPPGASGGIRRIAARGTIVNAAFTVGLDTLNLLRGLIVAALLLPSDYGVWTILLLAIGTLGLLKEGMVGDKFVQQDESDQERAFQRAFTLEAILNGILLVLALVALPLVALAYGESEILLPGLVVSSPSRSATLQSPLWIFYRQMRFLEQRKLQAVDPVVAFVVTVGAGSRRSELLEPRDRHARGPDRRGGRGDARVSIPARVPLRARREDARVHPVQHPAVRSVGLAGDRRAGARVHGRV